MTERYAEIILSSPMQGFHDRMMSDSFVAADGYLIERSEDRLDVTLTHRSGGRKVIPWSSVRCAVPLVEEEDEVVTVDATPIAKRGGWPKGRPRTLRSGGDDAA